MADSKVTRLPGLFRTAFFAPAVTTLVAVATVWRYLYHPRFGLLEPCSRLDRHRADRLAGGHPLGDAGDHPAVDLEELRRRHDHPGGGAPGIPESLYEAARLEGAGSWRQLVDVTLPMLAPTFLFVAVMTCIGYFQLFAEPYVITRRGSRSTAP